ncbi:hypothetical protein [Salana multivorans]
MSTPDGAYAKPFLTIPEQIRRLRGRGMDCGADEFASGVLERYGYYRLSGYWHLYELGPNLPRLGRRGRPRDSAGLVRAQDETGPRGRPVRVRP